MPEDAAIEDKTYKVVQNDIAQFISLVGAHNFTSDQIDQQFNIKTRDAKRYRWQVLDRLVKDGQLQQINSKTFRSVQSELIEMDWQGANAEDSIPLLLPCGLHKYVKVFHKSINIVAGAPGAGKTAFLYNTILLNMDTTSRGIYLFTNDMSPEEIKERMINSGFNIPKPPPFKTYDRADNFGDVVDPNGINVIDYLDMSSEVYLIGEEIEKIYRKLDRGCAFIGIQKKPGQDVGIGGIYSSKRAKNYFSLDTYKDEISLEFQHKLTIYKARGRVDSKINPRQVDIRFKLLDGVRFVRC